MLNDAFDLATSGESVAIFTLDMSVGYIAQRLMKMAGTDDPAKLPHIRLVQLPCGVALGDLVKAIRLAPESVIIIDYISLISLGEDTGRVSQYEIAAIVSEAIRKLAEEEQKCIITAFQLSRDGISSGNFTESEIKIMQDLKFLVVKKHDNDCFQIGDQYWDITEQLRLTESTSDMHQ